MLGCAALLMREWSTTSLVATGLVGVVGLFAPVGVRAIRASLWRWVAVVAIGILAFAAVRARFLAPPVSPATLFALFANVVAAVSEEAFFRRFAYARLERHGVAVAIGVTALLFAVVHVPIYGLRILPLDIGAGLVFGWQRWASGTWTAPAATHIVANILMMR